MRRASAAVGTLVFLVVVPGVVAGLVPWMLTGWDSAGPPWPLRVVGALLVAAGVVVLLQAFARFVTEGLGTPAPVAPTERLVVGGLYRYVRNPMYLAVGATIVGQAVFGAAVVSFVRAYEEPTLQRTYGEEYDAYRRAVPGWWPRRTPWQPGGR